MSAGGGFDLARFRAATFTPRTEAVPVADLAAWFPAGVPPVWVVRGITGEEWARANDANNRVALYRAAVEALASAAHAEQADALKTLLGVSDVPDDLARRFDYLVFGSVDPVIDRADAVRLFQAYPYLGYLLSNKVLELTGKGPNVGEAPHSTAGPTS